MTTDILELARQALVKLSTKPIYRFQRVTCTLGEQRILAQAVLDQAAEIQRLTSERDAALLALHKL